MSKGTKDENDCSELCSNDAADWSCAISLILELGRVGLSKDRLSTDLNCRDMPSIGLDSRVAKMRIKTTSTAISAIIKAII